MIPIGTSALREAEDSLYFLEKVFKTTGLNIKVLTGSEEALYTLEGIKLGLPQYDNFIAIDIGGGSTEWIYEENKKIFHGSLNIGVLKLISNDNLVNNLKEYVKNVLNSNLTKKFLTIL